MHQTEIQLADRISSQSTPNPQKAVGLSVRGFMFCIAAHHCLPLRSLGLSTPCSPLPIKVRTIVTYI